MVKKYFKFFFKQKFQLSETDNQSLPPFPDPKEIVPGAPDTGPILPVPRGIRPTLAKYR
jgi:hypothetical protein